MKKSLIILISILSLYFLTACQKKMPIALPGSSTTSNAPIVEAQMPTSGVENSNINSSNLSSNYTQKDKFQEGKVSSNGKYLGSDGVSKSGIRMLYFASDVYTLDEDQVQKLMDDMPKIRRLVSEGKIIVEGNCDEFGTDEYNHALGLKRAKTVKKLLVNSGIDANKIDIVSYGESNPICTIDKPACHAKNRRVEINKI